MIAQNIIETIRTKFGILRPELNERTRRIWAATEANILGHGGVVAVSKATGIAVSTILRGKKEIENASTEGEESSKSRIRQVGGGRISLEKKDAGLLQALEALVDPESRGDPMSPLRWTCKSTRQLAKALADQGYNISHVKVGSLLVSLNYSLQGTRKQLEGKSHPDRDAQFNFINKKANEFQQANQPVISVDAKKKELIGNFSNRGQEYQPFGNPEKVETYDFPSLASGKGIPYGIYDLSKNNGWVSVGMDHDTAQFAVHSIRQWWLHMGILEYPHAKELLIAADGGGSNGSRNRLWKKELQKLANEINIDITVCHFPPGTSKWNKIEHRMFSYITQNWRGRPLISYEVIVSLISNTKTSTGLKIQSSLDTNEYPAGIKVSDKEMAEINLKRDSFHGDWNYQILQKQKTIIY